MKQQHKDHALFIVHAVGFAVGVSIVSACVHRAVNALFD